MAENGVKINSDKLSLSSQLLDGAISFVNEAESYINTGNRQGTYFSTGISDCVSEVKAIKNRINKLIGDVDTANSQINATVGSTETGDSLLSLSSSADINVVSLIDSETAREESTKITDTYEFLVSQSKKERDEVNALYQEWLDKKTELAGTGVRKELNKTDYYSDDCYIEERILAQLELEILKENDLLNISGTTLRNNQTILNIYYDAGFDEKYFADLFKETDYDKSTIVNSYGLTLKEFEEGIIYLISKSSEDGYDSFSSDVVAYIDTGKNNEEYIKKLASDFSSSEKYQTLEKQFNYFASRDPRVLESGVSSFLDSLWYDAYIKFDTSQYKSEDVAKWLENSSELVNEWSDDLGDSSISQYLFDYLGTISQAEWREQDQMYQSRIATLNSNIYSLEIENDLVEYELLSKNADFKENAYYQNVDEYVENILDETKIEYSLLGDYLSPEELKINPFSLISELCERMELSPDELTELSVRIGFEGYHNTLDTEFMINAYNYLDEEEKSIYNYLFNLGHYSEAANYLYLKQDEVNKRSGTAEAQNELQELIASDDWDVVEFLKMYGIGFVDGVATFDEGMLNAISSDGIKSELDYKKNAMFLYISYAQCGELESIFGDLNEIEGFALENSDSFDVEAALKSGKITQEQADAINEYNLIKDLQKLVEENFLGEYLDDSYEFGITMGNMSIPMLMGISCSLLGSPLAGRIVSNFLMGSSVYGNELESLKQLGYEGDKIYIKAGLTALSEIALGTLLGKMPGMSIMSKYLVLDIISEGIEEFGQEWIDEALNYAILGEPFNVKETWMNSKKAFVMGAMASGLINGSVTIAVSATGGNIDVEYDHLSELIKKFTRKDGSVDYDAVYDELMGGFKLDELETSKEKGATEPSGMRPAMEGENKSSTGSVFDRVNGILSGDLYVNLVGTLNKAIAIEHQKGFNLRNEYENLDNSIKIEVDYNTFEQMFEELKSPKETTVETTGSAFDRVNGILSGDLYVNLVGTLNKAIAIEHQKGFNLRNEYENLDNSIKIEVDYNTFEQMFEELKSPEETTVETTGSAFDRVNGILSGDLYVNLVGTLNKAIAIEHQKGFNLRNEYENLDNSIKIEVDYNTFEQMFEELKSPEETTVEQKNEKLKSEINEEIKVSETDIKGDKIKDDAVSSDMRPVTEEIKTEESDVKIDETKPIDSEIKTEVKEEVKTEESDVKIDETKSVDSEIKTEVKEKGKKAKTDTKFKVKKKVEREVRGSKPKNIFIRLKEVWDGWSPIKKVLIPFFTVIIPTALLVSIIYIPQNEDDFYLKLYGETNINLSLNNVYQEPGYKAYDKKDGDLTDEVVVEGTVNYKKLGSYILTYTVTNSRGETISKSRVVNIIRAGSGQYSGDDINIWENGEIIEITLDDFNEQIEKGKVYDGIKINTTVLLNQYINKFMLQNRLVYAMSLTSIIKANNQYASIYNCNKNYMDTEASGTIVTNGTLERIYNKDNACFANYGVFYFTKNKLHHTKVTSEIINQQIIDSKTRNTFVYQDVLVDNSTIVNNSTTTTKNYALCQSGPNTLKVFTPDKEVTYQELGEEMVANACQTGILLTEGNTIIYKSQYSSTLNIQRGIDSETDSIIFFYQKTRNENSLLNTSAKN